VVTLPPSSSFFLTFFIVFRQQQQILTVSLSSTPSGPPRSVYGERRRREPCDAGGEDVSARVGETRVQPRPTACTKYFYDNTSRGIIR